MRIEQLAPFPFDLVMREMRRYPNAHYMWAQVRVWPRGSNTKSSPCVHRRSRGTWVPMGSSSPALRPACAPCSGSLRHRCHMLGAHPWLPLPPVRFAVLLSDVIACCKTAVHNNRFWADARPRAGAPHQPSTGPQLWWPAYVVRIVHFCQHVQLGGSMELLFV